MKYFIIPVIVIITLLLNSCVPEQDILPDNKFIIEEGARPWVIAHGGSKALFPENTMMAFAGSVDIGVDVLEIDMKITKDGFLVCHHDTDIDRMSDGEGPLSDYTLEELQEFNFGEGFEDLDGNYPYANDHVEICLLEDVFDTFNYMYFNVEIKDDGENGKKAAEALKELIEKHNLETRILIASFDDETLAYFQELAPNIPVSAAQGEATKFAISSRTYAGVLYSPNAVALQLPMKELGINLAKNHVITSAHKHNMAIHYWTINDKEDMRKLIEKGADGLITDRPDIMNELLEEMGF